MRYDPEFHRYVAQGRYRPPRQWLNYPGSGATIRPRPRVVRRWRFGGKQIRILLLAVLLGALTWSQLPSNDRAPAKPVAAARVAR
jgi:hypothetical protein